ncbi:DsbA family protein [Haladaptatus caseinilyticus]|uniref:DsbA family protein n=1 Tax=Haladaptatus caseinilyticus TaxID=2993314 RepID=UPI00224B890B|nr:thioredoxin domain-containing protein [Haladaptatus caseinilyticus]
MPEGSSRRQILQLLGATATTSLSGCASVFGRNETTTTATTPDQHTTTAVDISTPTTTTIKREIESPSSVVSDVSIPESPTKYTYARMGPATAPVTATIYGSWKCTYTQDFVQTLLQTIIRKFVQPGQISLVFREVAYRDGKPFHGPDELTAGHAGLAMWNHAPESYWSYFATVFANQEAGTEPWATADRLLALAEAAGVPNQKQLRREIKQGAYQSELKQTMEQVANFGFGAVPRVVVDDSVTAPTADPQSTITQLKRALANSN